MTVLEFKNINGGYDGSGILHDLSFSVSEKQKVGIVGRNGMGKTTIVNVILGLAEIHSGELLFNGQKVARPRIADAVKAGIAIVPQRRNIVPGLTVEENLRLGGIVRRSGPWSAERVNDLFPFLKLKGGVTATALSGGQQQILCIARALLSNPRLLILDEPSEGLAPVIVDEVADLLNNLPDDGISVLLIEQNLKLLKRCVDDFFVLSKGTKSANGVTTNTSFADLVELLRI